MGATATATPRIADAAVTERSPELRHYAQVLRRQAWLIVLVTAVAVLAAAVVTLRQKPVYRATMSVVVGQGGGIFEPQFGANVQPSVDTMASLFTRDVVASTTIADLGIPTTAAQLLANTQVSTTADSSVIDVTYNSTSRADGVRILGEMGRVFTTLVNQHLGANLKAKVTATVWDPAHTQPGQVSPHPARNLGIAAALGLAIGVVLAFVREGLNNRIRSRHDAERWFGAPVLATLPRDTRRTIRVESSGARRSLEAVSMVRASLQYLGGGQGGRVITVTSALPQEGKTTLVANLGAELASAGSRVICVEADLRRPQLGAYLTGPVPDHGLTDILAGRLGLNDVLVELSIGASVDGNGSVPAGRLYILPAGPAESNPADLLTTARVEKLVDDLRESADYVVFDTPPILEVGDAFTFARASDNVIVVAREGRTTREAAEAVHTTLERLEVTGVGVVLVGPAEGARSRR